MPEGYPRKDPKRIGSPKKNQMLINENPTAETASPSAIGSISTIILKAFLIFILFRQSLILDGFLIIMDPKRFSCQLISWDEACGLARKLANKIKSSDFRPDLVIAIGRGGYVPARIVCDFLLYSLLTSIKIEHWDIAASKRQEATVRFPLAVEVHDQRILIIDDVTDTGDTLRTAVSYVKGLGAGEIRTGVLQHKIASSFAPDFCADVIREWKWIIYPWAAHEDLVGFTEKVLSQENSSNEDIRDRLKEQYGLVVDDNCLKDVLDDLVRMGSAEKCGVKYRKI
jgi:hypoxanthine phosphoribosyltransferase